ncbi:hypothetical protein ACYF6T_20945 [Streptomyces sp. 7R007]
MADGLGRADHADERLSSGASPGYGIDVLGTVDRPVRNTIVRVLVAPLIVGLLLAVHPWTFASGTAQGPGAGDSQTYPKNDDYGVSEPTDTPADQATPDDLTQATNLDSLIQQSAAARESVTEAVADAAQCGTGPGLDSDITAFQDAAQTRSSLAQQATALDMSAVEGGSDAASLLATALTDSATADDDFADWATSLRDDGCDPSTATGQSAYTDAEAQSETVTSEKESFLSVWSPLASQYALTDWTADQF